MRMKNVRYYILFVPNRLHDLCRLKVVQLSAIVISFCLISNRLADPRPETTIGTLRQLFEDAESIAISSAAAIFFLESPDRKKKEQYEAWQLINSAQGQTGSGGRIQALEDLNEGRVDLEGLAIPKADLSGIDLNRGKLRRANCEETQLDRANLSGASLSGANLSSANLFSANLCRANLFSANLLDANLFGANLFGANLIDANLRNADLSNANLRNAELVGVNLSNANLRNADLSNANLRNADLSNADLGDTNLSEAILVGVDLSSVYVSKQQLEAALLCQTTLPEHIDLDPCRDCQRLDPITRRPK